MTRNAIHTIRELLLGAHLPQALMAVALTVAMLTALTACSDDTEDVADDQQQVTVYLTLALGDNTAGTRADTDTDWQQYSPTDPGTTMENYIDISRLYVYFYDNIGNYIDKVGNLVQRSRGTDTNGTTYYELFGTMSVANNLIPNGQLTGKMVVFANGDNVPPTGTTLSNSSIANLTYSYTPGSTLTAIPMYGVQTIDITLEGGKRANLPDIWLLRSMAKASVDLRADEDETASDYVNMVKKGYTIKSATLNVYNTQGYWLPSGYNTVSGTRELTYTSTTGDAAANTSFHPLPSAVTSTPIPFGTDERGVLSLYLPEFDNTNGTATITVTLTHPDGDEISGTFPFADYNENGIATTNRNIVRNHYYQFHVYLDNSLKINLEVLKWTKITHTEIEL